MGILIKERFLSGVSGRKVYVTKFLRSWALSTPWGVSVVLCLTAILFPDRFRFFGFVPFRKKDVPFIDIDKIEYRKAGFGFRGLLTLLPKSTSTTKICFFVRKPELWIEHFKKMPLRVECIEATQG